MHTLGKILTSQRIKTNQQPTQINAYENTVFTIRPAAEYGGTLFL